jgi:hypothetical protein
MAAHLVLRVDNFPHQARLTVGHPTENKESRLDPGTTEEIENPPRIISNPQREFSPTFWGNSVGECFDWEVVLDVNADSVREIGGIPVRRHKATVACCVCPSVDHRVRARGSVRRDDIYLRTRSLW